MCSDSCMPDVAPEPSATFRNLLGCCETVLSPSRVFRELSCTFRLSFWCIWPIPIYASEPLRPVSSSNAGWGFPGLCHCVRQQHSLAQVLSGQHTHSPGSRQLDALQQLAACSCAFQQAQPSHFSRLWAHASLASADALLLQCYQIDQPRVRRQPRRRLPAPAAPFQVPDLGQPPPTFL